MMMMMTNLKPHFLPCFLNDLPVFLCRNFMIQGGDPTGTGKGGESIWGKPFKDELNSKLVHSGRGVVSMANSGPHTNGSQFFILYKSANHLNFKHTVFGGVVGGLTTLAAMEKVPVDDNDQPLVSECLLVISVCNKAVINGSSFINLLPSGKRLSIEE